jgi:hypothetical protein
MSEIRNPYGGRGGSPADELAAAIETAAKKNGWKIIGTIECRQRAGEVPWGLVAFERAVAPFEGREYGTAEYCDRRAESAGVVFFQSGHYDLTRTAAFEDLGQRSEGRTA